MIDFAVAETVTVMVLKLNSLGLQWSKGADGLANSVDS